MEMVKDYRGNEIENLLAYGVRTDEGYDYVAPSDHALKDYVAYQLDNGGYDMNEDELSYEEQLARDYELVLRRAVLYNIDRG